MSQMKALMTCRAAGAAEEWLAARDCLHLGRAPVKLRRCGPTVGASDLEVITARGCGEDGALNLRPAIDHLVVAEAKDDVVERT